MNCLLSLLVKVDLFGVPFTPFVFKNQRIYKTSISGFLTIIIYSISMAYFIYSIYQWQTGKILPTIQSENQLLSVRTEQILTQSPITIDLIGPNATKYLKGKKIFNIRISEYLGIYQYDRYILENGICSQKEDAIQTICLDINNPSSNKIQGDNSLIINVYKCIYEEDHNCVTEQELKNSIESQSSLWLRITQWQQQINLATGEVTSVPKINYQIFDLNQMVFTSLYLVQAQFSIDRGLLFQSIEEYSIISENEVVAQPMNIKDGKYKTFHKKEAYAVFQIALSRKRIQVNVQIPKLGSILAQIGAVIQIILILKYLCYFINEISMDAQIISEMSTIYLPQKKQMSMKQAFKILLEDKIPTKSNLCKETTAFTIEKLNILSIFKQIAFMQYVLSKSYPLKELEQLKSNFDAIQHRIDIHSQSINNLKEEIAIDYLLESKWYEVFKFFNFPSASKRLIRMEQVQSNSSMTNDNYNLHLSLLSIKKQFLNFCSKQNS